jgi:hypothetical protein
MGILPKLEEDANIEEDEHDDAEEVSKVEEIQLMSQKRSDSKSPYRANSQQVKSNASLTKKGDKQDSVKK